MLTASNRRRGKVESGKSRTCLSRSSRRQRFLRFSRKPAAVDVRSQVDLIQGGLRSDTGRLDLRQGPRAVRCESLLFLVLPYFKSKLDFGKELVHERRTEHAIILTKELTLV